MWARSPAFNSPPLSYATRGVCCSLLLPRLCFFYDGQTNKPTKKQRRRQEEAFVVCKPRTWGIREVPGGRTKVMICMICMICTASLHRCQITKHEEFWEHNHYFWCFQIFRNDNGPCNDNIKPKSCSHGWRRHGFSNDVLFVHFDPLQSNDIALRSELRVRRTVHREYTCRTLWYTVENNVDFHHTLHRKRWDTGKKMRTLLSIYEHSLSLISSLFKHRSRIPTLHLRTRMLAYFASAVSGDNLFYY